MKIKEILHQNRRDFTAEMICECCGHKQTDDSGYDDAFYHQNVIPNIKCGNCGESTVSSNNKIEPRQTKYPEGFQI